MSPLLLSPRYSRRQRGFIINPYAYGGAAADPYTVALLHFNGTNNANGPYTDSSPYSRTFTNNAGAGGFISTTQSVFGGASFYLTDTGTSTGLSTPSATELQFGSGDFTVEWRYYHNSSAYGGGNIIMAAKEGTSGNFEWRFSFYSASGVNNWNWEYSTNGTSYLGGLVQAGSFAFFTWHPMAIVRHGSNLYFYQGGTRQFTASVSGTIYAGTGNYWIGSTPNINSNTPHYFDEYRISKGIARYTGASYTVDTSEFAS